MAKGISVSLKISKGVIMNRILKMLELWLSVVVALPLVADTWTDPESGRTWSYRMIGDTAEITQGDYSDWIGDLIIPDTLGDALVTSIGPMTFSGCSNLFGVVLHNGVDSIGRRAFYGCSNLARVQMSTNVTSIEDYAFYECSNLVGVAIHNGITNRAWSVGIYTM